jgi:DNA-binding CsgD family transcriptional regulator
MLSEHEAAEVMLWLCGANYSQIGAKCGCSRQTVRNHIQRSIKKLSLSDRYRELIPVIDSMTQRTKYRKSIKSMGC